MEPDAAESMNFNSKDSVMVLGDEKSSG